MWAKVLAVVSIELLFIGAAHGQSVQPAAQKSAPMEQDALLDNPPSTAVPGDTASEPKPNPKLLVRSEVLVRDDDQQNLVDRNAPAPHHATAAQILSSAGTYSEF
jgi:hypothetical protein